MEVATFDLPKALRALADEYSNNPSLSMQLLALARAASQQVPATPDFLKICQEEMARSSITSLPMKLGEMAARGLGSIEETEEWMRTTRRNFVVAVTDATARSGR